MSKDQKLKVIMTVAIWLGIGLSSLVIGFGGMCFLGVLGIVATIEMYSL